MNSDYTIPSYVEKLSEQNKATWLKIFKTAYQDEGVDVAFIVANAWLNRKIKQKETMHRTEQVTERVVFEVDTSSEFLQYTDNGEQYVSFKLADVFVDKYRRQLTTKVLQKWADMINSGYPILGDIDHETSAKLAQSNLTEEEIKELSKQKPSIAKAVQAVVEKGRLWVKALVDKRYRKHIERAKGVSLEAFVTTDPTTGNVLDGDLTGFTFAINQNPVIDDTRLTIHG